MIGSRKVLAVIPARGGSKGLPQKNVLPVNGRPLLAWTVDAAHAAQSIDRVVLSSDDEHIIETALGLGCEAPFRRPAALATDEASSIDVVLHALDQVPGHDVVVLLQPTSPLRTAEDIDAACRIFEATGAPSCVSVSPVEQSPYWMYQVDDRGRLRALIDTPFRTNQRQGLPPVYIPNGAVYVADVQRLRESRSLLVEGTAAYVMPIDRSLDIDTADDLDAFRRIVTQRDGKPADGSRSHDAGS